MRFIGCLVAVAVVSFCMAQEEEPEKKAAGMKEVVISLANSTKQVIDQIKVNSSIDIIVEEPGSTPIHTVIPGKRVISTANDTRKKDGQTIAVYLTTPQSKAIDIFKEAGATFIIQMHKAPPTTAKKKN